MANSKRPLITGYGPNLNYKPPTAKQLAAERKLYEAENAAAFKAETLRQAERLNYLLDTAYNHPLFKALITKNSK